MKKIGFGVVLLCIGLVSFVWILTATEHTTVNLDNWVTEYRDVTNYREVTKYREVNHPYSTLETLKDAHFNVQNVLGMFAVNQSVGSFNGTNGGWMEIDISTTVDSPYTLKIASTDHGLIFNVTASKFNQTATLDYGDSYNITVVKRAPWYSTIRVSGTIGVYHNETVWHDNWVSEPYQEQESYRMQEPYLANEGYLSERIANVFPVYVLILPTSLIVISLIILATRPKN